MGNRVEAVVEPAGPQVNNPVIDGEFVVASLAFEATARCH